MKRKIIAVTLTALLFTLTGCTTDESAETTASVSEVSDTDVSKNASEEEGLYPVKIIPPESGGRKISAEIVNDAPITLYNGLEMEMGTFEASCPKITAEEYGAEVCEKINAEILRYRDECLERSQETVNSHGIGEDGEMLDIAREFYETARDRFTVTFEGDAAGENFICLHFRYDPDLAGIAPGSVYFETMIFDMRSGERVRIEDITAEAEGLSEALNTAAKQLVILNDKSVSADKYAETLAGFDEYFDYDFFMIPPDEDGKQRLLNKDMLRERFAVRDGCIGFYYKLHDFGVGRETEGSFAGIPLDEGLQYLNEYGRQLFAGYASAKSVPADIIEENGEKHFDAGE